MQMRDRWSWFGMLVVMGAALCWGGVAAAQEEEGEGEEGEETPVPPSEDPQPAPEGQPPADGAKPAPEAQPPADGAQPAPEAQPPADGTQPSSDPSAEAPVPLRTTLHPLELERHWRHHRTVSMVGTIGGGAAVAVGGVLDATAFKDDPSPVSGGLTTVGMAFLAPGGMTLVSGFIIDAMAPKTGRSGEDLHRWKVGMYRASMGAGLILAGAMVQFQPLESAWNTPTQIDGYHIAGAVYAVAGAVFMAEGFATAGRGLYYPRPMYGLAFVTAAALIIPKAIHAGQMFSPATWSPEHGIEDLAWVGTGLTLMLVETAATHESRKRKKGRKFGDASGARVMGVVPWMEPADKAANGLVLVGVF